MIWLIVPIFVGIAFVQIASLSRKKYWREIIVFSILHLIAFSLCMGYTLGVKIPSPMEAIRFVIVDTLHIKYPD